MYPHSREYQGILPRKKAENVITAEFRLPLSLHDGAEGTVLFPNKLQRHFYPGQRLNDSNVIEVSSPVGDPEFFIQLDRGDSHWKFDVSCSWIQTLSENCNFMRGSIYFRSKLFGNWEPFEFVKYFVAELSDVLEIPEQRIVESIFARELLERCLLAGTLEMTLRLEYFLMEKNEEQEAVLNKHRAEMNNALLPTSPKSDLRIKVGDEEFFVHMKHIKAFSAVSQALSKYVDGSNWDWSDKMTPDLMRALLRFIYYDEVDTINSPEIAFQMLQFSHLYQAEALFKICVQKLLSFSDDKFTFPAIFEMYLFVRIADEFQPLKKHFCGVLSRNASNYDASELSSLAQGFESGVGVKALVEILQYKEPSPPVCPPDPIPAPVIVPEPIPDHPLDRILENFRANPPRDPQAFMHALRNRLAQGRMHNLNHI